MDQADVELRDTVLKIWPYTAKEKIELLVPTTRGMIYWFTTNSFEKVCQPGYLFLRVPDRFAPLGKTSLNEIHQKESGF